MSAREVILKSYSEWTVLSALRSKSPIKSRKEIYPLIATINFKEVLDCTKGPITKKEFEKWHKNELEALAGPGRKLENHYGWAAKILNVYLKTYCYLGGLGRQGLSDYLHPPIDTGLWKGVKKSSSSTSSIIKNTHAVTSIAGINSRSLYIQIIKGMRQISKKLNCSLIEVEQLWENA